MVAKSQHLKVNINWTPSSKMIQETSPSVTLPWPHLCHSKFCPEPHLQGWAKLPTPLLGPATTGPSQKQYFETHVEILHPPLTILGEKKYVCIHIYMFFLEENILPLPLSLLCNLDYNRPPFLQYTCQKQVKPGSISQAQTCSQSRKNKATNFYLTWLNHGGVSRLQITWVLIFFCFFEE